MKKLLILIIVASASLVFSCVNQDSNVQSASILSQESTIAKNILVKDFQDFIQIKKNAIILDVRTQNEVDEGYLANSVHMDYYASDFKIKIAKLDKTKPILVYCHSGHRSGLTMTAMKEMGFSEVYNLEPGIVGWKAAGLPIEK